MRQPAGQAPRAGAETPATVSDAAIHAIVTAEHGDPFAVLGPHEVAPGSWEVRAMLPDADAVAVVAPGDDRHLAEMERCHPAGFFVGRFESENRPDYRLRVATGAGTELRFDAYSFYTVISDEDVAALGRGDPEVLPRVMGARPMRLGMAEGAAFAVWAPNARRVSVVGEFNAWDGRRHPMRLRHGIGVWELFVPGVAVGARYKFEIKGPDGTVLPLKADPVAFAAEHPPATASVLHGMPDIVWDDDGWIRRRTEAADPRGAPISIYECHLGSWARVPEEGGRYLTYAELGDRLIPYVKDLGFTHIELLPITEYPFDGSWGYQPVSLFAPTSRFGTPEEFARFVDTAHAAGIGVLLDWVPGHFPNDPHGLALFDGTHLYEHADPRQGFHQDWGTFIYNFGREEVAAFLVANARFWLDRYHLDGLRIDAVASLLYLDYSRKAGEWIPNRHGGNENLEAIEFLKRMNAAAYGAAPGVFTVAEESTAWPGVSRPAYAGGLGFGFKWNMGWMHDTLRYMQQEPIHRRYHHDDMTFGIVYAFSENFVLPLSHDEVVHGKGSLLGRMPGDRWRRFANLRAYFGFMWGHPGKKLLFMGGEFAQEREWNHDISLDWHLLDDPDHAGMHRLVGDLNRLYRDTPALHELDCESQGFEWLVGGDADQSVLVWLRRGLDPDEVVVVASNFTPVPRESYAFGVPLRGTYTEVLNTDHARYAGSGVGNPAPLSTSPVEAHGHPWRLEATLPPLSTIVLRRER